jgi:hypothetical protein
VGKEILMSNDIEQIEQAAGNSDGLFHYQIGFRSPCRYGWNPEDWVDDEMTVKAGPDAEVALQKLKANVFDEAEYGIKVKRFRLIGIKLMSEANF